MPEVVLVSSVRTPVGRAFKGMLRATRPDELGAVAIKGALERVPQIDAKRSPHSPSIASARRVCRRLRWRRSGLVVAVRRLLSRAALNLCR